MSNQNEIQADDVKRLVRVSQEFLQRAQTIEAEKISAYEQLAKNRTRESAIQIDTLLDEERRIWWQVKAGLRVAQPQLQALDESIETAWQQTPTWRRDPQAKQIEYGLQVLRALIKQLRNAYEHVDEFRSSINEILDNERKIIHDIVRSGTEQSVSDAIAFGTQTRARLGNHLEILQNHLASIPSAEALVNELKTTPALSATIRVLFYSGLSLAAFSIQRGNFSAEENKIGIMAVTEILTGLILAGIYFRQYAARVIEYTEEAKKVQ